MTQKITIIKNWVGRQVPHLIENLTQAEQELCNTMDGLFDTLSNKFHPQHTEMINSSQYCKLSRQNDKKAKE